MLLDLAQLEGGRLWREFRIAPNDPILAGYDAEVREPLRLVVELASATAGTYVLTGRLEGTVQRSCRRCLTPVAVPVEDRFRVVYQEQGPEAEAPGDDDLVPIARGARTIEIGGEVRDRLFLETERFPLCRENCPGLCPECGRNLSEGACGCAVEVVDGRWEALRALRSSGGEIT